MNTGTSCSELVANPATGRIVVMNRGNIRQVIYSYEGQAEELKQGPSAPNDFQ